MNSTRCSPRYSLLLKCFPQTSHSSRLPSWTPPNAFLGTLFFWSASNKHHTREEHFHLKNKIGKWGGKRSSSEIRRGDIPYHMITKKWGHIYVQPKMCGGAYAPREKGTPLSMFLAPSLRAPLRALTFATNLYAKISKPNMEQNFHWKEGLFIYSQVGDPRERCPDAFGL